MPSLRWIVTPSLWAFSVIFTSLLVAGCTQTNIVGMNQPVFNTNANRIQGTADKAGQSTSPTGTTGNVTTTNPAGTSDTNGSLPSANSVQQVSRSVGIGDTIGWVKKKWKQPTQTLTAVDKAGNGTVRYGTVILSYQNGRVASLEDDLPTPISKQAALRILQQSLPRDAQESNHWTAGNPPTLHYMYSSNQVKQLFSYALGASGGTSGAVEAKITPSRENAIEYKQVTVAIGNSMLQ